MSWCDGLDIATVYILNSQINIRKGDSVYPYDIHPDGVNIFPWLWNRLWRPSFSSLHGPTNHSYKSSNTSLRATGFPLKSTGGIATFLVYAEIANLFRQADHLARADKLSVMDPFLTNAFQEAWKTKQYSDIPRRQKKSAHRNMNKWVIKTHCCVARELWGMYPQRTTVICIQMASFIRYNNHARFWLRPIVGQGSQRMNRSNSIGATVVAPEFSHALRRNPIVSGCKMRQNTAWYRQCTSEGTGNLPPLEVRKIMHSRYPIFEDITRFWSMPNILRWNCQHVTLSYAPDSPHL